jgi:hypothetical protein
MKFSPLKQLRRQWRHHHQLKCIGHLTILRKVATENFYLHRDLVRCVHRKITSLTTVVDTVIGYTKVVMSRLLSIERSIFYAHPCFQGEEWYNWAMVQFEEMDNDGDMIENIYPS